MRYVEWVHKVAEIVAQNEGASYDRIAQVLGLLADGQALDAMDVAKRDALLNALDDLDEMGVIDASHRWRVSLTQEGRMIAEGVSLRTAWPQLFAARFTADQLAFIEAAVVLGHFEAADHADSKWTTILDVRTRLGWDHAKANEIARQLRDFIAFVKLSFRMSQEWPLRARYGGVVRIKEREQTEAQQLLDDLVAVGETAAVDFKRELALATKANKAEFVKDALALGTSVGAGRRFLIVGIEDQTLSFYTDVDPAITQERLEQILHSYAAPAPDLRYTRVEWGGGFVGLIELLRDRRRVPYKVSVTIAHITAGDVYVRHGTLTSRASPAEIAELEAEARRP